MSFAIWVLLGVVAVLLLGLALLYNRLVSLRARTDNGWAGIDVQLRRRYDLIPNLVETVQGYAAHERELFENYPELKANENFLALQEELTGTESKIAYARQFYNDQVMKLNTAVGSFPSNVIANAFHFQERAFFSIDDPVRGPVTVDLNPDA